MVAFRSIQGDDRDPQTYPWGVALLKLEVLENME